MTRGACWGWNGRAALILRNLPGARGEFPGETLIPCCTTPSLTLTANGNTVRS
jgi:hypothetical protein